jgi:hypothetical protein
MAAKVCAIFVVAVAVTVADAAAVGVFSVVATVMVAKKMEAV